MRTRHVTRMLVLLALAGAPVAAAPAGLSARLGLLYTRYDYWFEENHSTLPHLDLDLALDARGVVVSRDLLTYSLGASWRRVTDEVNGAQTSKTTNLGFNARAGLLHNPSSPFSLDLHAARGENDYGNANADVFGRAVVTSAGTWANYRGAKLPALGTGYDWSRTEDFIPGLATHVTTTNTISSQLSTGTPAFDLNAAYSGTFREGTWATDNNTVHGVSLNATAPLASSTLSLSGGAELVSPSQLVPGTATYKQETSAFAAMWSVGGQGNAHSVSYSYGRTFTESSDAPYAERMLQSLRLRNDVKLTSYSLFTRWTVYGSLGLARSGDTELRTTGETLNAELWWRQRFGETSYEVHGGPSVGLTQADGRNDGGYGATAGAHISRPVGAYSFHADYTANYASDLYATIGTQFTQALTAELSGRLGTARVNAFLRASSFRTSSPVTGAGAGRMLDGGVGATMRRLTLEARLSLTQGMIGATPDKFVGDGLLLPAPFDSSTVNALGSATYVFFPGLAGSARARLVRSNVPGRPVLYETEWAAALTYRYGAFGVALEDRYLQIETVNGWNTVNTAMVNAYRAFAW